ncbi:hypothetical protein DYH55_03015 [Methylovirgula sp. 4M-Z18]|nr:hypothetical protein DYH55_03015 [Methylovirgula sp. 4M-Z18]
MAISGFLAQLMRMRVTFVNLLMKRFKRHEYAIFCDATEQKRENMLHGANFGATSNRLMSM